MARQKRLAVVPVQDITRAILVLRGQRVLLDAELAALYGGHHQAPERTGPAQPRSIPGRLYVQLTTGELVTLRSQIATLKGVRPRAAPQVLGRTPSPSTAAIQAANVLNSPRAWR